MRVEDIEYIALRLRERDAAEVHGIRWDDNPILLARQTVEILTAFGRGHVVSHNGRPAAVIGVCEVHPHVWQGLAYGTDEFGMVVKELSRLARDDLAPFLIERGAHRLEVISRAEHRDAHKWLSWLGAQREGVMRKFGKDGADYVRFAWVR